MKNSFTSLGLIFIMSFAAGCSDSNLLIGQTSSSLAKELQLAYAPTRFMNSPGYDNCRHNDDVLDTTTDIDVEFGSLSISTSCRFEERLELNADPSFFEWDIPFSKVIFIRLSQPKRGDTEVFNLFFMVNKNCTDPGVGGCITWTVSYTVRKDWKTGEHIEPYRIIEKSSRNSGSIDLQNYSEENLKASKRIFNALKRYAEINDWEIKFEDETYQQVKGSMFD